MSNQSQSNSIDLPKFWAPVDISRAAFVANNAVVMGQVSIESSNICITIKSQSEVIVSYKTVRGQCSPYDYNHSGSNLAFSGG